MKTGDKCLCYSEPHGYLVISMINLMVKTSFLQFSNFIRGYGCNYGWSAVSASFSVGDHIYTHFATF